MMNDSELLELIRERDPDDLTVEECDALRAAVRRSPALLREAADRIRLEQHLAHGLGRPQVSVEKILARAAAEGGTGGTRTRLGIFLATALAAVLAVVVGGRAIRQRAARPAASVSAAPEPALPVPADAPPAAGPATVAAVEPVTPAAAQSAAATPPSTAEAGAARQPAAQPPVVATPAAAAQPAPPAPIAADPNDPWNVDLQAVAARQPSAIELFTMPLTKTVSPDVDTVKKWFAAVNGKPSRFSSQNIGNRPCGTVDGLVRMRAPLADGTALRLAALGYATVRIHAWSGTTGVTFDAFGPYGPWVAYATTRSSLEPLPTGYVLASRSEGRMDRTISQPVAANRPPPGIELRYADGRLTLARGDVRIVEADLAAAPTDIFVEGPVTFAELAMTRAIPIPMLGRPAGEPRGESLPPARQTWIHSGTGTPPLILREDGGVEVAVEKNPTPVWSSFVLPAGGPREIVFRLDAVGPGTGICLGDAEGRPQHVLQFLANKNTGTSSLQLERRSPGDNSTEAGDLPTARPLGLVRTPSDADGGAAWIKVSQCGGVIRCSVSADGTRWTQVLDPLVGQPPFASVGLHAAAHPTRRLIRLRDVVVRPFATIEALAPAALADAAVELPGAVPVAAWLAAADESKPPAADRDPWRRACAVRQLAGACSKDLAIDLLLLLWRDSLEMSLPLDGRLQLLDEIMTLAPVWNDPAAAARCAQLFESLGERLADAGSPRCHSQLAHLQQTCPLLCGQPFRGFSEALARRESLELAVDGRWEELGEVIKRLAFFGLTDKPSNDLFFAWAAALAESQRAPDAAPPAAPPATQPALSPAGLKPEWRHPIVVEASREGIQWLADLDAALRDESHADVCGSFMVDSAGLPGLLPARTDPDLFRSFATTAEAVMRDHPQVQEAMREDWGPRAVLRVRQAIDANDPRAVEAATVQFVGTEAAAEAHAWLGDRALAAGDIASARDHFRRAGRTATAAIEQRLATAAAVADECWARDGLAASSLPTATGRLPAARGYEAVPRARLEGDVGANPAAGPADYARGGPGWSPNSIDWVARQASLVAADGRLLIANRFQLASHDPQTGQLQWRAGVGGDAGNAHDWPGQPMRPVVTATHAFVRRLKKTGPALAAIQLADGVVRWETKPRPDVWLVSDPVHVNGVLHACTATKGEGAVKGEFIHLLALTTFDAATGELLRERPLATLRDQWWQQRDCQMAAVDESLVITCGGSVICCDLSGGVRWMRRDFWVPTSVDSFWLFQSQSPPAAADGRLFVVQPGVPAVMAIDAADGRVLWKCGLPGARRVLGCVDGTVVVERSRGIDALAAADGRRRWRFESADLLDACLVGGGADAADGVLLSVREPADDPGQKQPTFVPALVWLDAATGGPYRRESLPALRDPLPSFGPILPQGERIWALFGRGMADASRDIVELVPR